MTARANTLHSAFDETYSYDDLNRLTAAGRNGTEHQSWDLDAVGNFDSVTTDGVQEDRTHNAQNQLTAVGSASLAFDANGNTTTDQLGHALVYDAWNRLMEAKSGATSLIRYEYDAANRRVEEGSTVLYYSSQWQVVEERQSGVAVAQHVWSPVYVDAAIERDRDSDANGSLDERIYVLQDANYNVTTAADDGGTVIERYLFDPYGTRTVLNSDFSADGDNLSDIANRQGHQGGFYDAVLTNQLLFRNRVYDTDTMRWMQQDPAGYVDGSSLYSALAGAPARYTDADGLVVADAARAPGKILSGIGGWLERLRIPLISQIGSGVKGLGDLEQVVVNGIAIGAGTIASLLSGDAWDLSKIERFPNLQRSDRSILITINGIFNTEPEAKKLLTSIRSFPGISERNRAAVVNGTHGILGTRGIKSEGDLLQIFFHETLGVIDIPALHAAQQIQVAAKRLRENGRDNACTIYVVAHSQGTMIFNRALELLSAEDRAMIEYYGNGGEALISQNRGLRRAVNYRTTDDPIRFVDLNPLRYVRGALNGDRNIDLRDIGPGVENNHGFIANYSGLYGTPGQVLNRRPTTQP